MGLYNKKNQKSLFIAPRSTYDIKIWLSSSFYILQYFADFDFFTEHKTKKSAEYGLGIKHILLTYQKITF